jgi:hypothetical protein
MAEQSDGSGPDLMVLAAEQATELDDVTSAGDAGVVTYRRAGVIFARVSADALEVRLPPDIAEAALRTPDTSALPEGPDWVRFTPVSLERHDVDRAAAWFQTAWRHAGP